MKNVYFYIPNQTEQYVLRLLNLLKITPNTKDEMFVSFIDGVWKFSDPVLNSKQISPASVAHFVQTGETQRSKRTDFIADWIALHNSRPCNTEPFSEEELNLMFDNRIQHRESLGFNLE